MKKVLAETIRKDLGLAESGFAETKKTPEDASCGSSTSPTNSASLAHRDHAHNGLSAKAAFPTAFPTMVALFRSAAGIGIGAEVCSNELHGLNSRRNRHRERTSRSCHSRKQQPRERAFCHGELRRNSKRAFRVRTIRARARLVYRGRSQPGRQGRSGKRRHVVPR